MAQNVQFSYCVFLQLTYGITILAPNKAAMINMRNK